jgi:hypothetical protein
MKKFIFASLTTVVSLLAHSFPDMIRHGYTNCTACHVSPSGGGVLNRYGRSLSKELISSWSTEKEDGFLHGLINTETVDDWLALGGDIRGLQVHQENDLIKRGRWITMQAGLEVAVLQPLWSLVAFIGQQNVQLNEWKEYSPRYYALINPMESLYFKVGRFLPNFGINHPDHIFSTRGPLQFGYGMEKSTAEVSWLGENWNFIISRYATPKETSANHQTGTTAVVTYTLGNFKSGVQYLSENDDHQDRKIIGALGYLGWTKEFGTLIELDRQTTTALGANDKNGISFLQKSSYEVSKGLHVLALNDYFQADLKNGATKNYKFGPGIQWFPRPHLDIQAFWTREQTSTSKEGDYAWLVLHYYL